MLLFLFYLAPDRLLAFYTSYILTKRWIMSLGSLNYLNKDVQTPMLNRVMGRYNRVVDADCIKS